MTRRVVAITDQVWREDVFEQQEMAQDCAKVFNDFFRRLTYQGAPQQLAERVAKIRDQFAALSDEICELRQYFPSPRDETARRYYADKGW